LSYGETATEEEVIQRAKKNMAAYKIPRQAVFTTVDKLLHTTTEKTLKRELKRIEIEEMAPVSN